MRKKGTPKTGGRVAGTPNRVTGDLRLWVDGILKKNLSRIEADLGKLEPKDRLIILERLLQYSLPKQQSISVEAQIQAEYVALEHLLSNAPDEAIAAITDKLIKLNQLNRQGNE